MAKKGLTYLDVLGQLRQKRYAPVYFLYGEESYYIDMISDFVESNVLDEMAREFDQTVIYGKDVPSADVATVIAAARRFPMMGQKQVIVVKEAQNIKKWEALGFYMEKPVESTLLVFCYKYGKPDGRMTVFRNFEKNGGVMMESARIYDNQMPRWIIDYVSEWGKKQQVPLSIEPQAALLIADSLGNNLSKVVSELQKLIIASPQGTTVITPQLVERNIGISKDYSVFELEKAMIAGDSLKAYRIVYYFAQSKDHPIQKELSTLFSFFANLMIYHYLPKGLSDQEVASALGLSSRFFVSDYVMAAKRFNGAKTMRIIGYIRDTDARSKGINNASADDKALWQELIYKIMH